jgi:thiamine-monophosphate kinase
MSLGEFDLIARWFTRPARRAALGVGDDCALLQPTPGRQLAVSSDMLVEGRHFLSTVPPQALGHKALAVNLSDLAACGAQPLGFTLALSLPRVDEAFLSGFSEGLWALAERFDIELVGGDTTAGPLNICITVFGEVPPGQALLRSGARVGDELWVSGTLGDARLALEAFRGPLVLAPAVWLKAREAMERPQPRVALGMALRGLATSAIDLSDGLVGDLGHVLKRSGVGAEIERERLPCSDGLRAQPEPLRRVCLLAGGDDYELLFTAPPAARGEVQAAAQAAQTPVSCIGRIVAQPGLRVLDAQGSALDLSSLRAFDHFAAP